MKLITASTVYLTNPTAHTCLVLHSLETLPGPEILQDDTYLLLYKYFIETIRHQIKAEPPVL